MPSSRHWYLKWTKASPSASFIPAEEQSRISRATLSSFLALGENFEYVSGVNNGDIVDSNYLVQADLDRDVLKLEEQNKGLWESFVIRPWHVVDEPPFISKIVSNSWIYRTELGAAMVDAALNGNNERIINNAELRTKGQAALGQQAKGSL